MSSECKLRLHSLKVRFWRKAEVQIEYDDGNW